jgi:hypothetical protein
LGRHLGLRFQPDNREGDLSAHWVVRVEGTGFAEEMPDIRVDENFMAIASSSKETDGFRSRPEVLSKPDSDPPACRPN